MGISLVDPGSNSAEHLMRMNEVCTNTEKPYTIQKVRTQMYFFYKCIFKSEIYVPITEYLC